MPAGSPYYLISKGNKTYDLIQRVERIGLSAARLIKVTGTGVSLRNISCNDAGVYIDASEANGCTIFDCGGQGGGTSSNASGSDGPIWATDSVGIYLGTNSVVTNCRMGGGYWVTYAISGSGAIIDGASSETVRCVCRVGWAPNPDPTVVGGGIEKPAYGCVVRNMQTEKATNTFEIYNATGCSFQNNTLTGGHGTPNDQPIINLVWSSANGGTVTATTNGPHNLPVGNSLIILNVIDETPPPIPWRPSQFTIATRLDATRFTYPHPTNPGTHDANYSGWGWTWPLRSSISVRKASQCSFISNNLGVNSSVAQIDLDWNPDGPNTAVQSYNMFIGSPGNKGGWKVPAGKNAAGWKFIICGSDGLSAGSNPLGDPTVFASPAGNMTFSQLPGQFVQQFAADGTQLYQGGPFEGQEFDISDGSKFGLTPPSAAVWGDRVIGGGNGKYRVRYNSSVWIRIG